MSKSEFSKTERSVNQESTISGDEVDGKGKSVERRSLKFGSIELSVLEPTFDALHGIKRGTDVDMGRAISFLLDCGAVFYSHLTSSIKNSLEEIKKENASH